MRLDRQQLETVSARGNTASGPERRRVDLGRKLESRADVAATVRYRLIQADIGDAQKLRLLFQNYDPLHGAQVLGRAGDRTEI